MAEKDEKLNKIIESLKRIAANEVPHGKFKVEFSTHGGEITGAIERPSDREIKLG